MGHQKHKIKTIIIFISLFYLSNGCQMEGVTNWLIPVSTNTLDTFTGSVLDRSTSNIEGINGFSYGEGMNGGPYLDVAYANSRFVITTNAAYANYEEIETSDSMSITVNFACTGGSTGTLVFLINVIDTNNNAPQFRPSDVFEFTVAPPLPPGFLITGCFNDITVRDIDLTTQRIDFDIEDNPYFEIAYDASSNVAKEFKAILRTTTFIRSLPEPVSVRITATDVDLTGDPPLSTSATVIINGDTEFEFPEEPVFSRAFYLANYTDDDQFVSSETISLQSGYHEAVQFTIQGEHSNNFQLVQNGNQVSINVITPLSADVLMEKQIFLVLRADREYTSGGSATVIVRLPEGVDLEFERAHYEGTIENNILHVPLLVLTQGYEGGSVSTVILSEFSSYFSAVVQGNTITLTMTPLNENVINENNFIYLQVEAITDRSITTTVVTLEIIKDDNITPVFNNPIYTGSYNPEAGLTLEQIVLVQGYDETVSVYVEGEHAEYFQLIQNGPVLTLSVSTIPPEIYGEQRILLSIEATKPRTVGANAAVIITLPEARGLEFEETTYRGTLQDNVLTLGPILLRDGYDENVNFTLTGDYATYFSVANVQNVVTVNLMTLLPESIILENNIVILALTASGLNALTTTTSVLLDIIKDDITTPVFSSNIYSGTYVGSDVDIADINLIQGFDDTVTFRLDGDHAQYFEISSTGNSVALSLRSVIPEDVIFNEKVLLFNILADKALTVGASAAILIRFPSELTDSVIMRFSQNTYTGTMENNVLTTGNVVLSTGYATGTQFLLSGDYSDYFTLTNVNNVITVTSMDAMPSEILENNRFIVLEIEARRDRAVSVWTSVVIDIIKQEIIPPVFTETYYVGVYSPGIGLQFNDEISLNAGYDESVIFGLEGDSSSFFTLSQTNNMLSLTTVAPIPEVVLENNSHLLFVVSANKPNSTTARATISIDIIKEPVETVIIRFEENSYVGVIQNSQLQLPTITLVGNSTEDVNLDLIGVYATYFGISQDATGIRVVLTNNLPSQVIEDNAFITLELTASYPAAVSGYTTIVIEIIREQTVAPVFEQAYYVGEYSEQMGLVFEDTIRLIQGFDEYVSFALDGDDAQWFTLVQNGQNNISLNVINSVLPEDRRHLVFTVVATKPEALPTRATVIISLADFSTGRLLRFARDYYSGSLDGPILTLYDISLEGYSADVSLSFTGDYTNYFQLTNQGGVFTLQLLSELPDEIKESNNVLVFTLEAQIEDTRTHATIILEIVKAVDTGIEIAFEEAYYVGSYSEQQGLVFDSQIRLREANNAAVSYTLEGNNAEWFSILDDGNSITIVQNGSLPTQVQENNLQLVFLITAESASNSIARATIIISLIRDTTNDVILGFDRVTYIGYLQNNTVDIPPLMLTQGYNEEVTFTLSGELSSYFSLTTQGAVVTVSLQTAIPEQLIPTNRIIVLEIQASAPQAVPASATIVFEVVIEDDAIAVIQPIFDEAYYTGSFNVNTGLLFETPVTLAQGYGADVTFDLEGESSQWFSLVQTQYSVTLALASPIPAAVLANNRQLVFVITAQRPGSATARSTIVISITSDYNDEAPILGFDRVTYLGSIESNTASVGPITLIEGFTDNVSFTLFGELSSYFSLTTQGAVVTVSLQTAIPEQLIPTNRIIVLEIQASAPQAVPASATIVFEVVIEDDAIAVIQPVFDEAYYTGSFNVNTGLLFETPVTLAQGYGADITFDLEGESSQWFSLVQTQHSVTLALASPIPAAVLANNRQLVFVITAQRPGSATARSTIVISITSDYTDEAPILGFDRVTYLGSIESNTASVGPITLIEGFTDNVSFTLFGELSSYFSLTTQGAVVTVSLQTAIPEQLIPTNRIIVLEIQASAPQAVPASATIVFEVVIEDDAIAVIQPVFDEAYYTGSFNVNTGLLFETPVTLAQGYGADITFDLEGESSQWFSLVQTQNSVTLALASPIPAAVLANNRQLVFVITAQRPRSATARSTIVISITSDYTDEAPILGFDRVTYLGSIESNTASVGPITLIEGFTDNVSFTLFGELSSYFSLTTQGAVVTVSLQTAIPEQLIPTNRIIVLEIQASAPQAVPASATIVFEVVIEDDAIAVIQPVFDEAYYTGSFNVNTGLLFETPVTLAQGYSADITFDLEGESSQWFSLVQTQNSVTLALASPIPAAVLANNRQLVFVITAQRPGSATARSTIVISITSDYTDEAPILGFDRVTYLGSIESNTASVGPITLIEGFTDNVSFTLFGELSSYFSLTTQGAVVTVSLQTAIPEQLIPTNRIIVLEIQASAPQAVPASATIVFEVVIEDDAIAVIQPVFDEAYYTGSFNVNTGLLFETPVTLAQGYSADITFDLEGESSQWFSLVQTQNSVTLALASPIPAAVLANNRQLVFVITAQRPGSATARSTIVISITSDYTDEAPILGFDRVTYLGSIESNTASVGPITLIEGFTDNVSFTLFGELSSYFSLTTQGAVVTVSLQTAIPEQLIPTNRIIVLEIQASAPQAVPASATIVFEVVIEDDAIAVIQPVFDEAYYTGSFNVNTGLLFETPVTLSQGYGADVTFDLEGESSQWFSLVQTQNSVTLALASPIPAAVLANNRQLVFVITAQRPGSATARSTIVISFTSDYTDEAPILGFDRVTYLGSIESNTASLGPITLIEGFTDNVSFTLFGELSSYFSLTTQGAVVTVSLQTAIPEQLIPTNRIIVLEIQASAPQAVPASATIVFEVVIEDDAIAVIEPVFDEAYYTGSFNVNTGLLFETPVTLAQGYGADITFDLEGESSQWFSLVQTQNSVTLALASPIPAAVLANNRQLVFVITAQRPGSATARSTIVISITSDYTDEAPILGFDRVTYLGSIESNTASLGPITLIEGFTDNVSFTLFGELSSYFSLTTQGAVVTVSLQTAIPEQLIPTNRIIVLEIQASAPQAVPASATIVFEVVIEDDAIAVIQPVFDEAYYTGSFNVNTGLLFETPVTLAQGYGADITFDLEGESSQWFSLVQTQNSMTLALASPIPAAVLANNRQLVFVITAQRPGSATARSTIVISITSDYTDEAPILGFDRVTYLGSIESNTASVGPITLIEGFTDNVSFTLFGELSSYFSLMTQGAVVTVSLQTAIPEQLISTNRIIVLEIQASAPQAVPASATIVFEVVIEDDAIAVIQPVFDEAYYTGSFNVNTGLLFETPVTLAQGYGADVTFDLEGESSQWFSLMQTQNSVTLALASPIPAAVLANNRQFVFVITAQRPGSATARSTIVISITSDYTDEAPILGFDRVTYLGSIESNTASLGPITLIEGFTDNVSFTLFGELSSYFSLTTQGAVVTVSLQTAIPEQLIPTNRIIVLEIQASAPQAVPASATIVFEVVIEDDAIAVIQPVFDEAYYTGSFNVNTGLLFETPVTLAQGYGADITFDLEGESSQWFSLVQTQNSVTLALASPIPAAVLANNRQLVFVITAQRPGSATARSTIVISITSDYTDEAPILGFDRVTYLGSIESNTASVGPITLIEGFTDNVSFTLFGELSSYFSLTTQGAVVTVSLQTAIPEQLIPTNRIIVLEIQASAPQAVPASATIVFEVVIEDDAIAVIQPIFDEAYYTGSFNVNIGLLFETPVTLAQGYGADVTFDLEGESSQWFSLVQTQNSVTLALASPIPAAVLANNRQLVFVITAQRPGSATARSTIVISITSDYNDEAPILGFDRVTYLGSIESNTASVGPITLIEGFTDNVSFTLFGELSSYFSLTTQGAVVTVSLQTAIPEQLIPTNRIIVLEIQASAPQAVPASATIVFEVVIEDDAIAVIQPVFDEAYYTGSFNVNTGLLFETPVTLAQGYGADVTFDLEGESSQWFSLVQTQNSVTLALASPIPAAVLANNRQLVFVITAQRPGSATARSTIVICITSDYTDEAPILGFDRVTYLGSIESNTASVGPITLIEGFTDNVSFTLFGELSSYFSLTTQGAVVTVSLQTAIPEQLIPTNRIIVLEIQASAPQAVPASATIVFEVVIEDDAIAVIQPVFDEAYYTGSFNVNTGLLFETPVTLAQGYGADVTFDLEGESSQWFSLVQTQNSVTLALASPIPAAVLANNRQLVFVITAQRPGSATARSTIVISITSDYTDEAPILGFDRVTYLGSIESNTASVGPITLIEGFTDNVYFTLFGELSSYFSLTTQGAVVTVSLQTAIPEQLIPTNRIIVLEIQASAPQAVPASATIVFEVVIEDDAIAVIQPVFDEAYYTGSFNVNTGLLFETPVTLSQGYGADVTFDLEGESSQWFSLVQTQNSVTLALASPIPAAVLANNRQLVFVITAQRPGSATARSTIVISFTSDYTDEAPILGFDRVTYLGSIESNTASLGPITLIEGFTDNVSFTLFGELSSYFSLTTQGAVVTVSLQTAIPEQLIPTNRIIVLEIQASAPQAVPASATIVFEVVIEDDAIAVIEPVFDEAYYTGSFNVNTGLLFETPVTLAQGYGADITFDLEGESSQWFSLVQTQNSVTLALASPIPAAVLANNRQLVFVITAQRPGSATARSTIVISITSDYTDEALILGFDRVTYLGSIESNTASVGPITLIEGFTDNVSFTLFGELSSYFSLTTQGAVVTVSLQTAIPEQLIPTNRIIVLEIQASAPQAVPASATIVFEVVIEDDAIAVIQPVFDEAYYTGSFNVNTGLLFETPVTLAQGYGADITFDLEGESSQWFSLVQTQNSMTLALASPIPAAVLANNRQLVFVITAQRPGSATARSTIVISITSDYTDEAPILGFDRVTYLGSIESNTASVGPITLIEGFTDNVSFTLFGELSSYFSLMTQGAVVTVSLQTAIPEQLISTNRIIVLEIQASAPQAVPASATIVFEVVIEDDAIAVIQPVFDEAYYTGSFNVNTGLLFETPVTLAQGYGADVTFDLEGESSQWFSLMQTQNSVTLALASPIPAAVLANNRQFVFVITAQRPGSATARSTIVISITSDYTDEAPILGFDRVTYLGSIESNTASLGPITLIEGFTDNVSFTLFGELSSYFSLTTQGAVVTVSLQTAIPEQLIPTNRIIVLEIQASAPQAVPASATIVFEVVIEDDAIAVIQPVFDEAYYTGSFNVNTGLLFETPVTLAQGYGADITFDLEGESSQWFSLVQTQNSVTLALASPIPAAVLANNRQLVFVITAQRPGSATARSTIVISITSDYTDEAPILGFDRVTYLGSIESNTASVGPITLIEGFTDNVSFTLFGELSSYFSLTTQGAVVTVSLQTAIPEQLIPTNRIIVLEIQASAPQAVPASATIVFEVVIEDDAIAVIQPIFDEAYYTGSFNVNIGLLFETPVTLAQGYGADVTFDLEGESSQWFSLVQTQNSVTLALASPIPAAVLANNRQLVFVITAQRPGSATARSTIVISITSDYNDEAPILGFDRVTYLGSIESNTASVGPITLIEGFTDNVSFTLFGELSSYFSLTTQGAVVTVSLQTAIPEQLIPTNRIIVLEIQASAPQAVPASATIVFEVVIEDDAIAVIQPVFDEAYYTGSFNVNTGLLFETPVTLAQGYGADVTFDLEGESSQWFSLVQTQNSVTLALASPIPAAVLANNRQLVFVITAQRPGSATARSTIVICITSDYTDEAPILGFDRVTYLGSIESNTASVGPITLIEGFTDNVSFTLFGELSSYFSLTTQGAVVTVSLQTAIPEQLIPTNRIIVLEIQASAPQAVPASATIVFEVVIEDDAIAVIQPVFDEAYYTGSFNVNTGLLFETPVTLAQGYGADVTFDLEGESSQWFSLVQTQNSVTLALASPIPAAVLANNRQLVFVITAQRPGSATARSTIVISITSDYTDEAPILGFDRVTYLGSIESNTASVGPITLIEGFTDNVYFTLFGELSSYFSLTTQGAVVTVSLQTAIPEQLIPTNRIIVLEIQASASQAVPASATIVFEVVIEDDAIAVIQPVFDEAYYTGSFNVNTGLLFETPVTLAQGYGADVTFDLEGESSQWFSLVQTQNSLTLALASPIPADVLANSRKLVFVVTAQRPGSDIARAAIIISFLNDSQAGSDVSFEKVFYEGFIHVESIQHEAIRILGYNGTTIVLHGEYSSLFVAYVADGVVTVHGSGSLTLPDDVTNVPLELHAGGDRAVLLLRVLQSGVPSLPSVTFSSPSYELRVEIVQTGLVGRVTATAENGELIGYTLQVENAHLQSRISINNEGELHLSAPANSGVYNFQVIATTAITQATATATVHMSVEAITVCGQNDFVVPPLMILDRDEEESHENLVVLNTTQYPGCQFTLTNRWPVDQTWLYVDETGLHTTAIDREHQSIAFMAVSQVQVELFLHCDSDNSVRTKRSERSDVLGPYDYGTNKWILTDNIPYNSRRSMVNLIVNDINDNTPIFFNKEYEPIAVGYPTQELEESILPRSVAELQATDADIGENAELLYWSPESELAVASTTGFVHLRSGARLEENQALVVHATDRNGDGLTGSIQLLVKLLDKSNIVVVTIRDAFLDDERSILAELSAAVGYDVKSLRSVVVSDDVDGIDTTKRKREATAAGASLQLYVYGLIEREPVTVDRLTADINNNAAAVVNVISTVSLEDHLEACEICVIPGRDTGLLVSTIVLSILLFILIVLIALWLFLRRRKNKNYDEFSDENSIASRNESVVAPLPKPEGISKPRLNIEELKKSERRLQEMLNTPIEEITVEPTTSKKENPYEAILDISSPDPQGPIVIQSIDKLKDAEDDTDDDEFGENKGSRRKSVVTFNENVEKIIHVEDSPDELDISDHPGYEIYKF